MDHIAMIIGYFVLIALFMALAFGLLSFLAFLISEVWIRFTENYRAICNAESLIHEYKVQRKEFLEWQTDKWLKERKNGN